jgi:hypothetical protein
MYTLNQKRDLALSLVEPLNQLAIAERNGKILCEIIRPITHSDLMALSDAELNQLQELVRTAQLAKRINKNGRDYETQMHTTGKPKYKIVL